MAGGAEGALSPSPSAEKFKERLHPAGGKASGARCAAAPLRSNTPPSSPSQVLGIFVTGQPVAGLAQRCRCGSELIHWTSRFMPAAPPQVDSRRLQDGRERIDVAGFREILHLPCAHKSGLFPTPFQPQPRAPLTPCTPRCCRDRSYHHPRRLCRRVDLHPRPHCRREHPLKPSRA